ncbi:hypothetical protein RAS1_00070 [Phycisphaerae bacterium RAS1]|nr:hypothetical protein RAS1_00070 [Phycisphaerae bacterium RAS1]
MRFNRPSRLAGLVLGTAAAAIPASASSHREAPFVTEHPKVDATDFYMFRSYEPGREDHVVLIANYVPFETQYGGPNYFQLDPNALYEILIDNNGDAREDLTFQFRFNSELRDIALPIGPPGAAKMVSIPLVNAGQISADDMSVQNVLERYEVTLVRGDRRSGQRRPVETTSGARRLSKPFDNIGAKSIPNYEDYARRFIYNIRIPGCDQTGRVFVGQRKDPFVVNLGETFDLVNITNPLGAVDAEADDLADDNITSIILELPIACLTTAGNPTIGAWTAASLRQARVLDRTPNFDRPAIEGGAWVQVSRLSAPLVNEVVIGLKDKNRFNASEPKDDGQFADYVTHPTLPALLEILFGAAGVRAPTAFPRTDLVAAFLTGVDGLNVNGSTAEMLRLNTSIAPQPASMQNNLGVIGGDTAGFPNGRRPGDDVVDIELRVAMGILLPAADAPSGQLPFTDGAIVDASFFDTRFPFLRTPVSSSPNMTP